MTTPRRGMDVELSRVGDQIFLKLTTNGKVTHADYEELTPKLDKACEESKHPSIYALVDMRKFQGWEPRAAWDDLKLGLRHSREFTKLALVGNKSWEKTMAKASNWVIKGESRYFEDAEDAAGWLGMRH